jgi:hypothetical protein
MTEEKGGNRGRKGRRRYFQPKKDGKPQGAPGATGQGGQSGQGGQGSQSSRPQESRPPATKARKSRRRARSRQRFDDNRAVNLEAEVAYVAPKAVYIYEHSVHPELRDSYEFRPEHFSKVGRTLADYQIDLAKLFPGDTAGDGTPVMTNMLPKPEYDWTGWEEEEPEKEKEDEKG